MTLLPDWLTQSGSNVMIGVRSHYNYAVCMTYTWNGGVKDSRIYTAAYSYTSVDERLLFLVACLHCLVLYDNIVFVFLAKHSLSLSLSTPHRLNSKLLKSNQ